MPAAWNGLAREPIHEVTPADGSWEVKMLISQALAHGASGVENPAGGGGPLILLGVAVVFVLVLMAEKKWRRRKPRHNDKGP